MLCTKFDGYMKQLCHDELMISWQITLTDETVVYGDYEREGFENPWIRLKKSIAKKMMSCRPRSSYICLVPHKRFSLKTPMASMEFLWSEA